MNIVAVASGKVICNMAAANSDIVTPQRKERGHVMTGTLPDDFLRLEQQTTAVATLQQPLMFNGFQGGGGGILTITVVQARLAKNYGVTRMDPYCRLRIGVQVLETPTAYNGSKTPRWNRRMQCQLPEGLTEFYLEIFDERNFSTDEKIAWGMIIFKDEVLKGDLVDEWYSLSGKQGDDKEGLVNIILQYNKTNGAPMLMGGPMVAGGALVYPAPMMYSPGGYVYGYPQVMYGSPAMQQYPPHMQPAHSHVPTIPQVSEKDLKTLKEMCPDMDDEIIKTVLQQSGGNIDQAAAQLLEMSAD